MTTNSPDSVLRVGAFSAFYGDNPDNIGRLLDAGVDVLMGDYLAELTMLILRKNELRGGPGYARTFVTQLGANLRRIAESGVKVIANAGGLDPEGCAEEIRALCREQGVDLTVAAVVGDDLRAVIAGDRSPELSNMDTGEVLDPSEHEVLTANAYLGAWPIVEALHAGADIVVCPRMTDASLVVGPAAWHFSWQRQDWDRLAGAVVAGHLIECGGQVTGGNFSRFHEQGDLGHPGLPIAELSADGGSVITKVPGSGGLVSPDTVKAQLFYEVDGPDYQNPDVVTELTSVQLTDLGDDRVAVSGVRGRPPTSTTKLSLTYEGGYRNSMTIGVTGSHVEEKVAWLRRQVEDRVGAPGEFDGFRWSVIGPSRVADGSYEEATAMVVVSARDRDAAKVGRAAFADRIVQICLASVPGFYMTTPPQRERLFGVQWPCLVEKELIRPVVRIEGRPDVEVAWEIGTPGSPSHHNGQPDLPKLDDTATVPALLGEIVTTRSGDKGGKANLGVWVRTPVAYTWLRDFLTIERIAELMPEVRGLRTDRHEFTNLLGLNFVIHGYLERGVSSCLRIDPQAKGLGEYLGNRTVDVPKLLLEDERP
jgi:hypothetical protein